jgi:hypothetical protein
MGDLISVIHCPHAKAGSRVLARQTNGLRMSQVARNLSDATDGFLAGKRYLIHDRDPLYTVEFLETL